MVTAAAVGNVIEWYDFYVFGSLATTLAVKFFDPSHPAAALLRWIAIFAIGFFVRPLGALLLGRIGDRVGRKYTFLITLSGMGISTALIGVVPTYASIGVLAPIVLLVLRLVQGLCLGGEYGGAITYVAEHVPDEKRGFYTGWLQTSPTLGIIVSLAVIIGTRTILGPQAFDAWGWRIPFIVSLLLVAVAIYIRLRLQETPIFQSIKAKDRPQNPWPKFTGPNLKFAHRDGRRPRRRRRVVLQSALGAVLPADRQKHRRAALESVIVGSALLIATPTLVLFGALSGHRSQEIILAGFFWPR